MHARWTWLPGSVRERETHARSDNSFSVNDTSITRRGAAITISPSANPPKGDMDIVKPKGNPPRCVRIHGIDTLGGELDLQRRRAMGVRNDVGKSFDHAIGLARAGRLQCRIGIWGGIGRLDH